ncbi:MAG: sugar ABC transporter permease, partial [Bacillota bacterium]
FFIAPTLICLLVVLAYPLALIVGMSFFDVEPTRHVGWVFTGMGNYREIVRDRDMWGSLANTAIWTIGSVAIQFVVGLAGALVLREHFRGNALLRSLLLVPWATPAVVGALAWKWMYHGQYGLVNAFLRTLGFREVSVAWLGDPRTAMGAVIVTNAWRGFPFIMLMLLAGLLSVPDTLREAAAIDGASFWQDLRYVTLPQLRPVVLVSTLLAGIWTFNNFSYIYILTGGGPAGRTDILVTFVYRNAFKYFRFGYAAALSVVLFLLVLLASAAYIRLVGRESLGLD